MAATSAPHFADEEAARKYLEALRWPHGPVCPHCGTLGKAYETVRNGKHRWRCASKGCRRDFNVKLGTVFQSSPIKLHHWLLAAYLLCSSKRGISVHQLGRMLNLTYKSAWFMAYRIREAMHSGTFSPIDGSGEVVKADESFIGSKPGVEKKRRFAHKHAAVILVDRGGIALSLHDSSISAKVVTPIVLRSIKREMQLMTDEAGQCSKIIVEFAAHNLVRHRVVDTDCVGISELKVEGNEIDEWTDFGSPNLWSCSSRRTVQTNTHLAERSGHANPLYLHPQHQHR